MLGNKDKKLKFNFIINKLNPFKHIVLSTQNWMFVNYYNSYKR